MLSSQSDSLNLGLQLCAEPATLEPLSFSNLCWHSFPSVALTYGDSWGSISLAFLFPKLFPLIPFAFLSSILILFELRSSVSASKPLGRGRFTDGSRARDVALGLDGRAGGISLGLSFSSLRRRESSISSKELLVIELGETDNISSTTQIEKLKNNQKPLKSQLSHKILLFSIEIRTMSSKTTLFRTRS